MFTTPAGKYRGKPTRTKYNSLGLPYVVVCPTLQDVSSTPDDDICDTEEEYLYRVQRSTTCFTKSPEELLDESVSGCMNYLNSTNYDSCEIGVQCFSNGRWPQRTNLLCWWCLHRFETKPFPCPVHKNGEGTYLIRGVFCGPSCAKAWAFNRKEFTRSAEINMLIDELARSRGFGDDRVHIPMAPPRESLRMFRGKDGMSIEQFRELCARCFDVHIMNPPYITQKQVLIAECDHLAKIAKKGWICHRDNPETLMVPAAELAKRKREGMEIFAGIGIKRLTDYLQPTGEPPRKKMRILPN